jgi:formate dehydrogenase subunit delta
MATEDLVRMANQIAQFFAPYPEDEAMESVRDHLAKFWTPTMRRDLMTIVSDDTQGQTVHPLVLGALRVKA